MDLLKKKWGRVTKEDVMDGNKRRYVHDANPGHKGDGSRRYGYSFVLYISFFIWYFSSLVLSFVHLRYHKKMIVITVIFFKSYTAIPSWALGENRVTCRHSFVRDPHSTGQDHSLTSSSPILLARFLWDSVQPQ